MVAIRISAWKRGEGCTIPPAIGQFNINPARENPPLVHEVVQRVEAYQKHFHYTPPADFVGALTPQQADKYCHFSEVLTAFQRQLDDLGFFVEPLTEAEALDEDDNEL